MKRKTANQDFRPLKNEIEVSAFRDIAIRFPGDVYLLAVWLAMSDSAKSSSESTCRTTLFGLARRYVSMYGTDFANPLTTEDVMNVFRKHGIAGYTFICLSEAASEEIAVFANDIRVESESVLRIDDSSAK